MKHEDAKILIIDDKPENTILLEQLLEEEGYTNIESLTDPREVLPTCKSKEIDLVLLDIRMPYMDGFEVIKLLKSELPSEEYLPILVLTAQTDMETKHKALKAGANDFLTKPFVIWEVLNRIRNMLDTRFYFKGQRLRADTLEVEVQKRTETIRETRLEIIRRLGRAGEYRDNETGAHVIRMSKASRALAIKAGLGEEFAELILNASPMHDVGKIGIPDAILLKPGKLTDEERTIMKTHVEIGVDIIGEHENPMLEMARIIAESHHEKWDGSGYPKGLKGEDIPIAGRISAICDVFDALTSERPYKSAWPLDEAIEFLKAQSGQHFDPKLVADFIEIIPNIQKIREEFPDED
ncbi:MAG: response regulator [Alphaproteobacteria bacterium]|nr:response regulator [Alphaproteobacteria bacterium]